MRRSKIRKTDIRGLIGQLNIYEKSIQGRIDNLQPDMRQWMVDEIENIRKRVYDQDFIWSVQALVSHMRMRLEDFEDGRVERVQRHEDGNTCFHIKPMAISPKED